MGDLVTQQPGGSVSSLVNLVADAARDPAIDAAKLEALYRLQRQIIADDAKVTFYRELREVQAEMPPVIEKKGTIRLVKDGVDKGSIPFARYEDMKLIVDPILSRHGMFMTHTMKSAGEAGMTITSTLHHVDGHSIDAEFVLPRDTGPGRNPLQAGGSTASYGKRYNTENLLDLVRKGADDDGKLGGTKFILQAQADELRNLTKQAGWFEGPFLDRLFAGKIQSFEEIEDGPGYLAAWSTLTRLVEKKQAEAK